MSSAELAASWTFSQSNQQDGIPVGPGAHDSIHRTSDGEISSAQPPPQPHQDAFDSEVQSELYARNGGNTNFTPARLRMPSDASQHHSLSEGVVGSSSWHNQPFHGDLARLTPQTTGTPGQLARNSFLYGNQLLTPTSMTTIRDCSPGSLLIPGRTSIDGAYNVTGVAQYQPPWPAPAQVLQYSSHLQIPHASQRQNVPQFHLPLTEYNLCNADSTPESSSNPGHNPATQHKYNNPPTVSQNDWQPLQKSADSRQHNTIAMPASSSHSSMMLLGPHMLYNQDRHRLEHPYQLASVHNPTRNDSKTTTDVPLYTSHHTHEVLGAPIPEQPRFDQNYHETNLRSIFTDVHHGSLIGIDEKLLTMSAYYLSHIETQGLHLDCQDPNGAENESIRKQRTRDWDIFNHAWLTALQRQLELTHHSTQAQHPLRDAASVMDIPALEGLADELVRLCDRVDKYGLVDFQMGVAEDEIIDLILRCLAALEPRQDEPSNSIETD